MDNKSMTAQTPAPRTATCMFVGTHDAVLDEKARLVLPAPFRKDNGAEILSHDFFLTPHVRGFFVVRPFPVWERYIDSIQADQEFSPKEKRGFVRHLYNNSTKLRLDGQHRFMLSPRLRGLLRLDDSEPRHPLKIVGCGEHLEIWPASLYQGEEASITELSKFLDRFEGL